MISGCGRPRRTPLSFPPMARRRPNPALRSSAVGLAACCMALGLGLFLPGCASRPMPPSPGARGEPDGLEIHWWIVDDSTHDRIAFETLGEALLPFKDRPTGISDTQLALWKANGLRVVAVPMLELELLHNRLRTIGQSREQWFGSLPQWTPVVAGYPYRQSWTLGLDNGPIELPAGNLRLLCRGWLVPREPDLSQSTTPAMAAAMNIELLPQHEEAASRRNTLKETYRLEAKPTIENSGLLFPRLALTIESLGQDALIIVPEDPATDWKPLPPAQPRVLDVPPAPSPTADRPQPPQPIDAQDSASPEINPSPLATALSSAAPVGVSTGPVPSKTPTLGEAMLCDIGGVGLARRVVIVLVPRVPESYELILRQ